MIEHVKTGQSLALRRAEMEIAALPLSRLQSLTQSPLAMRLSAFRRATTCASGFFIPCLIDAFFPEAGIATLDSLASLFASFCPE
jgi:hypothetical protein